MHLIRIVFISLTSAILAIASPHLPAQEGEVEAEPAELANLRSNRDSRIQKGLTAVYRSYLEDLAKLQRSLTLKNDLDGAVAVREEIKATEEALQQLTDESAQPTSPSTPRAPGAAIPKRIGKWTAIFRSDNPEDWLSGRNEYCLALEDVPETMKFLRLRRMDTSQDVIIPLTKENLNKSERSGEAPYWHGTNRLDSKARHLGIADTAKKVEGKMISVSVDGGHFTGWGFGHKAFVNDGQYFCWEGKEIRRSKVEFEIAVSAGPLAAYEERQSVGAPHPE